MDRETLRQDRLAIRGEVLKYRDIQHVIPMLGTEEGARIARKMRQEVYGGKR